MLVFLMQFSDLRSRFRVRFGDFGQKNPSAVFQSTAVFFRRELERFRRAGRATNTKSGGRFERRVCGLRFLQLGFVSRSRFLSASCVRVSIVYDGQHDAFSD